MEVTTYSPLGGLLKFYIRRSKYIITRNNDEVVPVGTLRRNDAVIMYLDRNPKGHSNYKFIFALLVGKGAVATISSSRPDPNLNFNVAGENIIF